MRNYIKLKLKKLFSFIFNTEDIYFKLNNVSQKLDDLLRTDRAKNMTLDFTVQEIIDRISDIEYILLKSLEQEIFLVAKKTLAIDSNDHLYPRGTKNDNSRSPRFVRATEKYFGLKRLSHLDLGCSGGGLVLDFLLFGHLSVGIEGSDYSYKEGRAEWRTIPQNLFIADITEDFFYVNKNNNKHKFDIITCWEVLEHIPEEKLNGLFANIRNNLKEEGIFVASIATFDDYDENINIHWHLTIKDKEWWFKYFDSQGFKVINKVYSINDYVRGSGNFRAKGMDWDVRSDPSLGFHVTLQKYSS